MTRSSNQELGQAGEDLACAFLTEKGYRIIERNARLGRKEIDIIAEDRGALVFIEVKTKYRGSYGRAEDQYTAKKSRNLKRAAMAYFYQRQGRKRYALERVRFDLVAINIERINNLFDISHYTDIV